MTTRKQTLGLDIASELMTFVEPSEIFIGAKAERLYALERRRSEAIMACAKEWAKIRGYDDEALWVRSVPQALFDTLESYSIGGSIVAAEAFLKQFGWKVERPTDGGQS